MSQEVDVSRVTDPSIAEARKEVEFQRAMNPCPIDFSEFQSSNPRQGEQKEYDGSNFNKRQKYSDNEEPQFTTDFGNEPGQLPVEANRYRLIWSKHCPWAHRIKIAIDLLGLDKVISDGVVDPLRPAGVVGDWFFTLDPNDVDPVLRIKSLGEAYRKGDPNYDQRSTVPAIVDEKTGAVVNNDYHDLVIQLYKGFQDYISPDAPDIYPEGLRADIDALNIVIYADFNLAVNLAALVTSQKDYEYYVERVFRRLDWLEERLSKQRYLMGDTITEPDIRIFPTLARFDLVFYQKYYVNRKRLRDYPNLWNYAKDLYSHPAFGGTTDFDSMRKRFYVVDHTPFEDLPRLVPVGPDDADWKEPNDRAEKFAK